MPHQTRPIIGVNADLIPAGKTTPHYHRLHAGYAAAIVAADGLPLVMPPLGKKEEIDAFLDLVDGFVLSAGPEVERRRHPAVSFLRPVAPRRVEFDPTLVERLLERRIPLLAVGAGMLQLNMVLGGNLFTNLPDDLPRALPHFDSSSEGPHRHAVNLQGGSLLEEIYGEGEILVNSDHHQAIREVGEGLRVCAVAPDGVIEAVEAEDPEWFCIGVQWQPQSETASALDMQLFETFVQACTKQVEKLKIAA